MADFNQSLKVVLSHEGGYVNHPSDRGGPTNMGITLPAVEEYLGQPVSVKYIQALTPTLAGAIYRKLFWDRLGLDHIQDEKLATALFDLAVLGGLPTMVRNIQKVLGIAVDGKMGPHTALSMQSEASLNSDQFLSKILQIYATHFEAIVANNPGQREFLVGWLNRVRSLA